MEFTFSKVYLVTDEDYESLKDEAGVPKNYEQLSLCEKNSEAIIRQIEDGTSTAFRQGPLPAQLDAILPGNITRKKQLEILIF